jgi:hypothetical protein
MHARPFGFAKRAVVSPNSLERRQRYRAVNRSVPATADFRACEAASAFSAASFDAFDRNRARLMAGTFATTTRGVAALSALICKI